MGCVELTESEVAAAVSGDAAALEKVYRALAPRVQRYLWARGADDPEGTTNEVFLSVFGRLDRLEGGWAGLVRFVFSVAHARYVDDVRRRARRPVQVAYQRERDDRVSPGAETTVMEDLGAARVRALLAQLGEDQRDVVAMRVITGLTLEETASAMGRSVGAVKQLQRRGLLALRELIADRGEDHG